LRRRGTTKFQVVPSSAPLEPLTADTPPSHLSGEAQALWRGYTSTWELDHSGLVILMAALEAFDTLRAAQREIAQHGLVVSGRANPVAVIAKDARLAFLRGLRMLNLDLEGPQGRLGRPGKGL
jgi:phage terminase small subunit